MFLSEAGAESVIEREKKHEQNLLISQVWQEIVCRVFWCFDIGMATFVIFGAESFCLLM